MWCGVVRGFEIVVGVGRVVASLTEMRQKTYWTSQTVTAHKDGWPSLLVTTSVQGGPVQWDQCPPSQRHHQLEGGRKEGFSASQLLTFWRESVVHVVSGVGCLATR